MPKDKRLFTLRPSEANVLSQKDIDQTLVKLAADVISQNSSSKAKDSLVLIGIHRRGVPLAKRLKSIIEKKIKRDLPLGTLDITLYRDDLDTVGHLPVVKNTYIPFDLTDKSVILVDDVLFTRRIQLAVLIDRGHRELPISADYVGKLVETKNDEIVMVRLKEIDGSDEVVITNARHKGAMALQRQKPLARAVKVK